MAVRQKKIQYYGCDLQSLQPLDAVGETANPLDLERVKTGAN